MFTLCFVALCFVLALSFIFSFISHPSRIISIVHTFISCPRFFFTLCLFLTKRERVYSRESCQKLPKVYISREARGLQAAKSCTRAEHAGELNSHATWRITGQKSRLAIELARGLNSRLNQVARTSCQLTLFWKNWLFAFHSYTSINTPHSHKICVAIQREKP